MEIKKVVFEGDELEYIIGGNDDETEDNDYIDLEKTIDLTEIALDKTIELEVSEYE